MKKAEISELKSFANPPQLVKDISLAVLIMFNKVPTKKTMDNSGRCWTLIQINVFDWDKAFKIMKITKARIDEGKIPAKNFDLLRKDFLSRKDFEPDYAKKVSASISRLCSWVITMVKYYEGKARISEKRKEIE